MPLILIPGRLGRIGFAMSWLFAAWLGGCLLLGIVVKQGEYSHFLDCNWVVISFADIRTPVSANDFARRSYG